MLCPNCGKEVPEGENNCPSCGVSLNTPNYGTSPISEGNQPSEVNDINNETNNKVEDKGKSNKKADILTIFAVLLFVISFALVFMTGRYLFCVGIILSLTILIYVKVKYPTYKSNSNTSKASNASDAVLVVFLVLFLSWLIMLLFFYIMCGSFNSCISTCANDCQNFPG